MLKMKICTPSSVSSPDEELILEADLRFSKFDEFYRAAGNSLYARVFQCQHIGIVMCWGISITDHKWYPATIRGHACAGDENLRSQSQSERNIHGLGKHFVSLLGTDLGCSNYDEFYKAAGKSLYGRVLQFQPVGIVWCS